MLSIILFSFISSFPCTFYGKVKVVNYNPDYKVKIVTQNPNAKIRIVNDIPNSPGEWKFVSSGENLKIQIVNYDEDFKIQFVNNFPKCY